MSADVRVLLVDDFASFRRLVTWILQDRPEMRIIGEAVDAAEAVSKAQELRPDLVVLDMSLPLLNGMEVAREIRRLSAKTKIVFLSENRFPEVVREALKVASAFVVKCDATHDLLSAIDAALLGKRFVSRSLASHHLM